MGSKAQEKEGEFLFNILQNVMLTLWNEKCGNLCRRHTHMGVIDYNFN